MLESNEEINDNENKIELKNSVSPEIRNENLNINIITARNQNNQNNTSANKKNKTTQLFETLLGSKLILTENSNMLIEKPFTIFEILSIIHSNVELEVKMEIIEKLKLIISKLHSNAIIIIEKSTLKDSKSDLNISFMNELIEILMENSREPKLIEELLNLLEILISKSGTEVNFFWNIFERMSKLCEKNKSNYDGTKFLLLLKIINKFFTKNVHDDINNPSKFIFFNNNSSELKLDSDNLQSKNISLLNGFTFGIWVYPEKVNIDSTNKNVSPNNTLFYIHTNKNFIIEATIENDKLYYFCGQDLNAKEINVDEENNNEENKENENDPNKNVNEKNNKNDEESKLLESKKEEEDNKDKNEKKYLCDIEYNKWTLFVFTHKPVGFLQKPQFLLYRNDLNNPIIIDYIYPNFGNQKINKFGICKGFTGLISNVFMFNQALVQNKIIEELINYKFGLYNEQNINIFKSYIEQNELHDKSNSEKNKLFIMFKEFFKSIIFIYSPCRIKNNNICIDLVNNINAELNTNNELNLIGGYYLGNNYGTDIYHIGGASIFLPIYEYIFSSNYNSAIILEEGIQILIHIFKKESFYIGNQVKEDKNFFRNIYYLIDKSPIIKNGNIQDNNNLFTREIMLKFFELGEIIIKKDKQKNYSESYFDNILLNPKIISLYPFSVQKELYKKIKELYMNNCEYLYTIFDVKDILRTIIDLYDNDANYYCCEKHFRMYCEDKVMDNNYDQTRNKIYNPNLLSKIYDLLEIMKYILTNDKIITISQIENIILVLITEISPCLQLSLIKILQIIFNLNEIMNPESEDQANKFILSMEKEYIKAFYDANGIEHLLYVMSTSTLDIRYEILKLFYLICSSDSWNKKKQYNVTNEILPYICVNIFQIKSKVNQNNNNDIETNEENENQLNINEILFTGKEDLENKENNDIIDNNIKNEMGLNLNDEISKIKKMNTLAESYNNLNNEEKKEEDELNDKTFIEVENIITDLSLPIDYVKNYSNKINDNYVEKIYSFLIQWLINRFDNPIILDDDDEIYYESTLTIILNFVSNNGLILKSKFLRDLFTLSHYNLKNCKTILENQYFHQWLLDTLLVYQILYNNGYKEKTIFQKGICETILHLGIKLHNIIIINATLYEHDTEQENYSGSINSYTYTFQFLITWLYKIKKIGNIEYISAFKLINNIISDFMNRLKPKLTKENIIQNSLIWTCFLNVALIAYEFYFIHDYYINKSQAEEIENNELTSNKNNNFEIHFVINEEVLYNIENNFSPDIEKHNKILLSFYECLKIIWDAETSEINIDDDLNSNYQSIDNFLETQIFGQKVNEYSLEMNILLYSTEDLPFQDTKTHNIMKTILNIIILFIKTSQNKEDTIYWIKELKKYLIYLLIISHNINPQDTSILTNEFIEGIQESISFVFIVALNFLNNELKAGEENNNNNNIKNEVTEQYAKLFRLLFISYMLIIEKIIIEKEKEKNNNGGFWYGLTTALGALKNFVWKSLGNSYEYSPFFVIYKNIYLTTKNDPLFNLTDINQFKTNNFFEAFQKIKTNEEWKYALFENPNVTDIINNQFSLNYFDKKTKIRISNGDNIHINNNIYIREKKYIETELKKIVDTINKSLKNVIKGINKTIFRNLLNLKKSQNQMKYLHKKYFNWKGKWVSLNDYVNQVNKGEIKFKLGNHYTGNFVCTCLYSIDEILDYLPNFNKFDAKRNLFLDEIKDSAENNNSNTVNYLNDNGDHDPDNKDNISDYSKFKIIRTTYKGNNFNICDEDNDEEDSKSNGSNNKNKSDIIDLLYNKDNYENYNEIQKLLQFYYMSHSTNCIIDLTNMYIEKLLNSENKDKKPSKIYYNCCLVKLKGHVPGCLLCTNNYLYYIINYNFGKKQTEQEKCIGSLFCFDPNKHKLIRKILKKDIKQIFKKRYYYVEDSLEIFTYTNKSYYIKFNTKKDREDFYQYIINTKDISLLKEDVLSITKKWEHWDISTFTFLSFLNNFGSRSFKDLTQYPVFPWIIKDYESKKLNVFNETNIRELQKPIGALGSKQRISCFMQNYNESKELELSNQEKNQKENHKNIKNEENNNLFDANSKNAENEENKNDSENKIVEVEKRYFYSSHYSNPFYVVHYMYKLFPYCCCAIELQGDGFDKRERQFISIIESWKNCMNENTDVRELIPEFYFLPEMFVNLNKINFGKNDEEEKSQVPPDDFEYPKWSKNNPSLFIIKNRLALESDFVSENLNDWIDLIFGYKQKGVEAEKATNLFFDFTYEGSIDINKYKNKSNLDEYNSLISKVELGQTPSQIFSKNVDRRLKRRETTIKKIINLEKMNKLQSHSSQSEKINSISYNSSMKELSKKMLIYIKALKNRRIICVFNNGIVLFLKEEYTLFSESGLVFINEKTIKIPTYLGNNGVNAGPVQLSIIEEDFDTMTEIDKEQPITSIKNGKYIIRGGYYDSKFMIHETFHVYSNKHAFIYLDDETKISLIKTENENGKEKHLFVGTTNGKLFIYKINQNSEILSEILKYDKVLTDHSRTINDLYIDTKLNILATISADKTCNLYTYPNFKLFRVILLNDMTSLDNVFISNMPLPSVIVYSKNDSLFSVHTINGSFILKKKNMFKEIYSPKISKDVYGRDYLIYGTKYKVIVVCRLPLFTKEECIEIKNDNYNFPIKCLELREESEIIYFWRLHNYNLGYLKNKIINKNTTDNINLYI